jgi:hypothetical protein
MQHAPPGSVPDSQSQNYFARSHSNNKLPDPIELTSRLEEARTSAKLLSQVVANTPPQELLDNELVKEFADRCLSASRSVQGYMVAENPGPDNETMESLIDTNEQLQIALSTHQRAVLSARKQLGIGDPSSNAPSPGPLATPAISPLSRTNSSNIARAEDSLGSSSALAGAVGLSRNNGKGKAADDFQPPSGPPPGASGSRTDPTAPDEPPDPFRDPVPEPQSYRSGQGSSAPTDEEPRLAFEPFHPGGFSQSASRSTGSSGKGKGSTTGGRNTYDDDGNLYDTETPRKDTIYRY